ncbi:hypothetical protein [Nonlabens sp. Asnod2-A12]|uniref:hypothetical protein n=1 Tax=Nonlabens sp. Asnod2-A12 TaxID=3160578 RepID=UPI003867FE69
MKIFTILFFLFILSCKTENSVYKTQSSLEKTEQLNYEQKVYQLLNDATKYNKKSPIKTKNAFIYKHNTLIQSEKYLNSKVFKYLLSSANCVSNTFSIEQKENLELWQNDFESFNQDFDQKFVTNSRLQFISKNSELDNEDRFVTEVSAIFFNHDKAIIIMNYKNVLFSARLYVKENGIYSGKCTVFDPPSAVE